MQWVSESGGVTAVVGSLLALGSLWLRLSWRVRHEQARRKTLVALARSMPRGSELEDHQADGSTLRITVGRPPKSTT